MAVLPSKLPLNSTKINVTDPLPATKFSGMFPYVDVRLTDDVLDFVDPRSEFSISEYRTGLVFRG